LKKKKLNPKIQENKVGVNIKEPIHLISGCKKGNAEYPK